MTKVTNDSGSVVQSLAFDAWGLRRDATDWSALGSPFAGTHETERGYTGHEHLDTVGLIHMNGRVQDPILGRFISADPLIQAPYSTQSHNRYSYVWNNPASLVNPSGFCTMIPDAGCLEHMIGEGYDGFTDWLIYLQDYEMATGISTGFMQGMAHLDYASWSGALLDQYGISPETNAVPNGGGVDAQFGGGGSRSQPPNPVSDFQIPYTLPGQEGNPTLTLTLGAGARERDVRRAYRSIEQIATTDRGSRLLADIHIRGGIEVMVCGNCWGLTSAYQPPSPDDSFREIVVVNTNDIGRGFDRLDSDRTGRIDMTRILAHELGHAGSWWFNPALRDRDANRTNIIVNENPIMQALGEPGRGSY